MRILRRFSFVFRAASLLAGVMAAVTAQAGDGGSVDGDPGAMHCRALHQDVSEAGVDVFRRTLCADVVALDQTLVYNRFGSFNPFGMMFALRRDVVPAGQKVTRFTADACDDDDGTAANSAKLVAGKVRLRDCKRPRPLVLRANVADVLHLRLTNLLRPVAPVLSQNFCGNSKTPSDASPRELRHAVSQSTDESVARHDEVTCRNRDAFVENGLFKPGSTQALSDWPASRNTSGAENPYDWPASRGLNFAVQGLTAFAPKKGKLDPACLGLAAIEPGASVDCYYKILREGPYFIASTAAPSGGEGDGGSITHGLFGSIVAEKQGAEWYRSQVSKKTLALARASGGADYVNYAAKTGCRFVDGREVGCKPLLDLLQRTGDKTFRLFHNDLNAVVRTPATAASAARTFREFSVFFHDELKAFFTRNFDELGAFGGGQLAGVRDGFAINYGASGMGSLLLANRKGMGPAANCAECFYEEFFLSSWANGDPALLEWFSDDPSNVHHSYLNDAVVFRNIHAGPKETHVFHLHAHQWFAGDDSNRGAYLDSQTVAPQQSFSYDISGGGLEVFHRGAGGEKGWWETLGSGNRNRTVGDSIFHCHLYPHFAQGMWELWRVHDVFEDGTRKLPDGQWQAGLTLQEEDATTKRKMRPGSVDGATGRRIVAPDPHKASQLGTPIPALVPLPGQALPLAPSYPVQTASLDPSSGMVNAAPLDKVATFPGYPFYIAGTTGHRPPQAPLDIARALDGTALTEEYLDGGLPRHVFTDGSEREHGPSLPELGDRPAREQAQMRSIAKALAKGDMTLHVEKADLALLPYAGTPLERAAMAFHHNGMLDGEKLSLRTVDQADAHYDSARNGYVPANGTSVFPVNGAPAKPGAPFADPCGAPDALGKLKQAADGKVYYLDDAAKKHEVYIDASAEGLQTDRTKAAPLYVEGRRDPRKGIVYYIESGQAKQVVGGVLLSERDPLDSGLFTSDPGVIGFRRYEASAVQLDLITNRAGWHDPQARINVLSTKADGYKRGAGRISPKVSAGEQPFFFRALSGECIEFRHTNELPKDLKLDDFQVRTPTDTIGQHIHLVKFDVTASDGSGNGWNYEDGTLAADEIAARICAARNGLVSGGSIVASRAPGVLAIREAPGLCARNRNGLWEVAAAYRNEGEIWRRERSAHPELFQTTVQRWFADPILSELRRADDGDSGSLADRTLRTVFSHDHFGPSSIQQHGFYTALVIEPSQSRICDVDDKSLKPIDPATRNAANEAVGCTERRTSRGLDPTDERHVGYRKMIRTPAQRAVAGDPQYTIEERDAREFALAIADFATLYDPRDSDTEQELRERLQQRATESAQQFRDRIAIAAAADAPKGMAMLACEALYAQDPRMLAQVCNSAMLPDDSKPSVFHAAAGDVPPAWLAAGRLGDLVSHQLAGGTAFALSGQEAKELSTYLVDYRRRAAGHAAQNPLGRLARPVAPPQRPESISVDHHDPYLFNYKGEPLPLRVGTSSSSSDACALIDPLLYAAYWETALTTGVNEHCSIDVQQAGDAGDLSNAFASAMHDDPATPILETRDGDTVQLRLIQGAQEVQHTFTVEDHRLQRNHDQMFPAGGSVPLRQDATSRATLARECATVALHDDGKEIPFAWYGRADQYLDWYRGKADNWPGDDGRYWRAYDKRLARCFNSEGHVAAQEVGISEHFEFSAAFLYGSNLSAARKFQGLNLREALVVDPPQVSDTLVHFGSADALWNGAWGLLRVRKDPDSGKDRPIGMCGDKSRTVYAAVAAVEARSLRTLDGRTASGVDIPYYATGLRDPDGLFFALLDPRDLWNAPPDATTLLADWISDPRAWDIPFDRVRQAIEQAYERPEPLVLTLKAGECLHLTVLNALKAEQGDYLRDGLGDAPMPPIVPLNVDVTWNKRDGGADGNRPRIYDGAAPTGLKPSARLAVSVPLPVMQDQTTLPRPVGRSGGLALSPTRADGRLRLNRGLDGRGQIAQIEVYAGIAVSDHSAADIQQRALLDTINSADSSRGAAPGAELALRTAANDESAAKTLARKVRELQEAQARAIEGSMLQMTGRQWKIERRTDSPAPAGAANETNAANVSIADNSTNVGNEPGIGAVPASAFRRLLSGAAEGYVVTETAPRGASRKARSEVVPLARALAPLTGGLDAAQRWELDATLARIEQPLAAQIDDLASEVRRSAAYDRNLDAIKRREAHFIPYAFGAVPFKSQGDVIGHATQGLFGAIVVVPDDAVLLDGRAVRDVAPGCANPGMAAAPDRRICYEVLAPAAATSLPLSVATLQVPRYGADATLDDASGKTHPIRQFTLFWQDGLNLVDDWTRDRHLYAGADHELVADCDVCTDSYDRGEKGVSYRSAPFNRRLRTLYGHKAESHYNLNQFDFGRDFFRAHNKDRAYPPMQVLRAKANEEVVIHVVHPGGRARQRAFVAIGQDYDDLFPGFGFPRAALLAPGKAITASLTRPLETGCYLWFDGPTPLRGGGAWGLLDVVPEARFEDKNATSCAAGVD